MCEAFIEDGVGVTLIIPRTRASGAHMQEVNGLRVAVPTVILPGIDWYDRGRYAFLLSSLVFMLTSLLFLLYEKLAGRLEIIYTVDMDTFSFVILTMLGVPCYAEMHSTKPSTFATRSFFRHVTGIIATNSEIKEALQTTFGIPDEKFAIEPNGVDLQQFIEPISKDEARRKLSLPASHRIALYVGRFYDWKGLDIIVPAARETPEIDYYVVGGSRDLFCATTGISDLPPNVIIAGGVENHDIPEWLAAADALLILGTKRFEQSYRFTAPMKVYEYMAADRPIVASDTPALRSMLSATQAVMYSPDDPHDLSQKVNAVIQDGVGVDHMVALAHAALAEHTWQRRAQRISDFMHVQHDDVQQVRPHEAAL